MSVEDDMALKAMFCNRLDVLANAVRSMSDLYLNHEEMNELVDIVHLIPMSLDEWYYELVAKKEETEAQLQPNKPGDRVELIKCTDQYTKIEPGTQGTVILIDDPGTLHVRWDDGHQLGLVPGEDEWKTISRIEEGG